MVRSFCKLISKQECVTNFSFFIATGKRKAYECIVEDKTKDAIYLRIHEQLVTDFQLQHGSEFSVQAQFQLNRNVFCEKHWALDMSTADLLFPDISTHFK
jgi:hypothetical protein